LDEINDLPGKKLYSGGATKMAFTALSGRFPVIHLATHALANDEDPLGSYIEFYRLKKDMDTIHRLYEQEIYNLDMKSARLLILSACETGNGLLVNGEGVISLSRAFSYAGCKSVITSLWKADDIATAFIVKRLHHYLQKGFAKDEALQKAKIDYLNSNDIEDRFKSPAYWAHLVLIGDHQPLVAPGVQWRILVPVILVAGLLLFIFLKKRNRA
ncbi:MAG: CHAT domain-containing protein, partial [Ferruginibacter sp.]